MAEGYPVKSNEAIQAGSEVVFDDAYILENYGLSPEDADREVVWGTYTSTLRQLLTEPPKGCPVDIGGNIRSAHAKDPENGTKDQLAGLVAFGAKISDPVPREPNPKPLKAEEHPKKKTHYVATQLARRILRA